MTHRYRASPLIAIALVAAIPAAAVAGPVQTAASVPVSAEADAMAAWVVAKGDAHGLPFVVIDKVHAQVAAYDPHGALQGTTPALLGAAHGDVSEPGVGTMKLADITPTMRVTPAGRFEAAFGIDLAQKDILWLDYDDAIALHRVVTTNVAEHRLQRLATPSVLDNRISYGCINVPVLFYENVIQPLFHPANGIVYVLPETSAFGSITAKLEAEHLH